MYLRMCGQIRARGTVTIQQCACWTESAHPSVSDISFSRDLQSLAPSDMSPWVQHMVFPCNHSGITRKQMQDARCGKMQEGKVSLHFPPPLCVPHICVHVCSVTHPNGTRLCWLLLLGQHGHQSVALGCASTCVAQHVSLGTCLE